MPNFWQNLPKPFFALAPMEEVTDFAFREMFGKYSGNNPLTNSPHKGEGIKKGDFFKRVLNFFRSTTFSPNPFVMFTEFVNVDGLTHPEGFEKLKIDLKYSENQRPIVAQIWGTDPEKFYKASVLVSRLGFDGVDINMGCPQAKEIGIGACAALIKNPSLAWEIIAAVKQGSGGLPVSVKTRLGYSLPDEMENWVSHLLKTGINALTLHARTKQEMSKVPAHWEKISEAVLIRDQMKVKTLIIGNGDIKSYDEGVTRAKETACDGVMVGRGAFGSPWFFSGQEMPPKKRLEIMIEHARLFNKILGAHKNFVIMRKHFKAYVSGWPGAHDLRAKLLETKSLGEAEAIIKTYLGQADF